MGGRIDLPISVLIYYRITLHTTKLGIPENMMNLIPNNKTTIDMNFLLATKTLKLFMWGPTLMKLLTLIKIILVFWTSTYINWSEVSICNRGMSCFITTTYANHDDGIKWKHFPHYWPFVLWIHRSPVNSPHQGQWHGALMFSLFFLRLNKRLSKKQWWCWWFETTSCPLWRLLGYKTCRIKTGLVAAPKPALCSP